MNPLKKLYLYIKCVRPILLSHHPNCEKFGNNHTINIGKYRFCIGCYVGYPTAILGIIILYFSGLLRVFNSDLLFYTALILLSSFILSPLKLTDFKAIKIIQKALIGLGSSFLFWWVFTMPYIIYIRVMIFLLVFGFLITLLNIYHGLNLYMTCKKCEYELDWQNCPGLEEVFNCFKKYNLETDLKPKIKNEDHSL